MKRQSFRWRIGVAAITSLLVLIALLATGPSRALAQGGSATINSVQGQLSSAPAAPTNLHVVPYGALNFYITWTSSSTNQSGFQVYNGVTTQNVTAAGQNYYLWAVSQPSTYMCFAIRSYNASGYSAWVGMWTCATTPAGGQPAAPANVVATAYSTTAIKITFVNQANNETAFLFNNGVTTQTYNSYNEPAQGGSFSYIWSGLQPHTWMCFQVAAYNEWGRSAYVPSGWACAWTNSTAGAWRNGQEAPGSGSLNRYGAEVLSVSCVSAGNCGAGGYYTDSSSHVQPFVLNEANGTWGTAREVTGGTGFNVGGEAKVLSVSCGSPGNCSAGGYYRDSNDHGQAFVVSEINGAWGSATEVPGTASLNQGFWAQVASVSCRSAGNCSAGGFYTDGTGAANTWAFVVNQVNGAWQQAQVVPGLTGVMPGGQSQILSVSCASVGNCSAGGSFTDSSWHRQPFAVNEVTGTWGTPRMITGAAGFNTGGDAQVQSVFCPSAGNCSAGGFYWDNANRQQAFVVSEASGTWGSATDAGTAKLNATGTAQVSSVSCASAGNCSAGGYYSDSSYHHQPVIVNQAGGTWGTPQTISGTGPFGGYDFAEITSVSCAAAGNCSAVGYYTDATNNSQAFVVDEADSNWGSALRVPGLANLNAGSSDMNSVSCGSASDCSAGGHYGDSATNWQALLVNKQ